MKSIGEKFFNEIKNRLDNENSSRKPNKESFPVEGGFYNESYKESKKEEKEVYNNEENVNQSNENNEDNPKKSVELTKDDDMKIYKEENIYQKVTPPSVEINKNNVKVENRISPKSNNETSGKKTIYVDIILDTTYSMTYIYKAVYFAVKREIQNVNSIAKRNNIIVKWKITTFNDKEAVNLKTFEENTNEINLLATKVKFKGGSKYGYENFINKVLEKEITETLDNITEDADKYIILLTDSMPDGQNSNLTVISENPVKAVYIYMYSSETYNLMLNDAKVEIQNISDFINGQTEHKLSEEL